MSQRNKILVYNSRMVSAHELMSRLSESFNSAALGRTDANGIIHDYTLDDQTLAFFLPGIVDEDSPYSRELGAAGNAEIRDYVEKGGIFVGTCAGAYYACADIIYDAPWLAQRKTNRPGLDFFNALAKGPVPQIGIHDQEPSWYSDCTVTGISYESHTGSTKKATVAYGNGPALYPHHNIQDINIIARYDDVPGKPIAIASRNVGKGMALFVGVLPFFRYESCYEAQDNVEDRLRILMEELKPHEEGREDVWDTIVSHIKNHGQPNQTALKPQL